MQSPPINETLAKRIEATFEKGKLGRQQATAAALLVKLSDAEIASLPARTHLDILSHLHGIDTVPMDNRTLQVHQSKLYRNMQLDTDFRQRENARIAQVADAIIADDAIMKAKKNWNTLSLSGKLSAMQKAVDIHSAKCGLKPAKITTFHEEPDEEPNPEGGDPLLFIRHASYDFASGEIEVNTHEYSALHRFDEALLTLLHENNHNHQLQLIERLRDGQIDRKDSEFVQIALFSLNYTSKGMIPSSGADYQAYLKQPVEDHAEWAAQEVTTRVMKAGRTPPPPGPSGDKPRADRRRGNPAPFNRM